MKMTRNRKYIGILAAAIILSVTNLSPNVAASDDITIGAALPDISLWPAYTVEHKAMQARADELGANLVFAASTGAYTPQKYQDAIDSVIAKGVKVFAFDPYDATLFGPTIERLLASGIKVVNAGNPRIGNETSVVEVDTEGAVNAAVDSFVKDLGEITEETEVALLEFPSNAVVMERARFAKQALEAHRIKRIYEVPADCTLVKGADATQDTLQAHPGLKGLFALCGQPGVGAAQAAQQAGKSIVIYSYDGNDDELKAVKAGTLTAAVKTRMDEVGVKAVDILVALAKGESVEPSYSTGFDIVTKENVEQFLK